jgi:hypothetical protein
MALAVLTVVVSTTAIRSAVGLDVEFARLTGGAVTGPALGGEDDVAADPPALFSRELESPAGDMRELVVVFGVGNSSCATAITMSERNRARKKRLSIQGTGS